MANGKPSFRQEENVLSCSRKLRFPWLDVLGNVLFGLKLKPNLKAKDRLDVAKYYLELVGLTRFERSNIHELSGGMKQRVALARALAPNPRFIHQQDPRVGSERAGQSHALFHASG